MTENQIYPIPADFFDNSSNSSNLLKLDIFPNDFIITNSNSNSNNSIIGLTNLTSSSILRNQQHQHQQQQHQQLSALSPQQQYSNTSMDSLRENPMLGSTASIQIPQRNNSNSSSGCIINGLLTCSSNSNSSNILNMKYNNSQPPRIEADFSEYGLDALEAHSYSPNLLNDHQLHNHHNSQNTNHHNNSNNSDIQIVNSPNNGNNNTILGNNTNNNNNNTITTTTQPISTTATTTAAAATAAITNGDGDFITIYEISNSNTNSNTMWSDIGNAMITTKSEPFNMDDDYIFQIDKSDLIQGPTLAELNDETLLEDLIIEDYMHNNSSGGGGGSAGSNNICGGDNDYLIGSPHSQLHQLQSSSVDSGGSGCGNSNLHSPENSGSMPPQQLLQQQNHINQQQQQFSQQQHAQQQHNNQFQQHGGLHLNLNRNNGGASGRYSERSTNGGSSSPYDIYHSTPTKSYNTNAAFSPGSQASSSPLLMNSITPPPPHSNQRSQFQQNRPNRTALHDLLSKKDYSQSPDRLILGQSVPGPSTSILMAGTALSPSSSSGFGSSSSGGRKQISFASAGGASAAAAAGASGSSRLSSSAPTHLGLEQIWQRREPRQHLLSTGSLVEAESFSSISTGSVLSPEANDFSHDEGYSDDDSDHYEDYSTDGGSDNEDDNRTASHPNISNKNKERYFWQYNVQAKGPKGQRLVIKTQLEDPHVLNEVTDPVFSPNCSVRGIKHSGKARKGDGNDLTPNPRKLHVIGKELDKLGRTINDMIPVSELPFNVRPKSRKEKNKLASRACRLKKKAQHEANKIKLYGLEIEHKKLLNGISDVKRILTIKYQNQNPIQTNPDNIDELNNKFDTIAQQSTTVQIAGNSTDFVNKILDKVKAGQPSGGLEDLKSM